MPKFLKWLYLTDNGLMFQSAAVGITLSIICVISNQKFDINAAFWTILPLLSVWYYVAKLRDRRKDFALVRIFH